ncbi:MAG: ubiquinol-cytochrome C chaperone family protein [Pseudomonadota bacterium]|nr:ubiquinol-cytochrome C chaperone family protein [Pseudomonadota bacterium]
MALFDRLLGRKPDETNLRPLWHRVVEIAREPQWYAHGGIADSVAGRFDAITVVLSLVLLRLETSEAVRGETARLTELFVSDMDGQLRQSGIGDVVMGKHMGKLMSALGGRIDAFRAALAEPDDAALTAAVERNVTLIDAADAGAVAKEMRVIAATLAQADDAALLAGVIAR